MPMVQVTMLEGRTTEDANEDTWDKTSNTISLKGSHKNW